MAKSAEVLIGKTAWRDAQHNACYGHRDYIAWIENETQHAARLSAATLKRGMLAEGTKCRMIHYGGHGGGFIIHWHMALIMLKNLKRGYI